MRRRSLHTSLLDRRLLRAWSQEELARRSGVSRAEVSAIETGRLVPSVSVALALALALDASVEDLFRLPGAGAKGESWAWPAPHIPCRYWRADVAGRTLLYPAEATAAGTVPHDGVRGGGGEPERPDAAPEPARTLVIAGCDPAAGVLVEELASLGFRLIALNRSSAKAIELLRAGLVHAAGTHLGGPGAGGGNDAQVRESLGGGYRLLRLARWQEGVALRPGSGFRSVRAVLRAGVRWVGREQGSGARRCLDRLRADGKKNAGMRIARHVAWDHAGVAQAVRAGWGEAGICVRLAAAEAGLPFLRVQVEDYDFCFPEDSENDPRIAALIHAVRSPSYRRTLGELEGYDAATTGEIRAVS